MSEELMSKNIDTQPEADPTSSHYQNDPSFIDEDQTPEAQEKAIIEWQRAAYPGYVKIRSCEEIYDTIYHKRDPVVEGLIDYGTIILGGASKVGKSFLSLQLAYCVSQGLPFLGFKTNQTGVIYFSLEDVERRIQQRMQKMFGLEPASNLYFATEAGYVGGGGFEEQLNTVLHEHPDVGLVIVDVMQKIRNPLEQSSYGTDYLFITAVKELADKYGICLILVHHTRKTTDSDIFKMLSGSMGITAAVDGSMVLYKKERKSGEATLAVVGRDIRDRELNLVRDWESPKWELVSEEDIIDLPSLPDKTLLAVAALLSDKRPLWIGSADALVRATGLEMSPNALSRYLGSHVTELKKEYFIEFSKGRTNSGRRIRLMYGEDKPLTKDLIHEMNKGESDPQASSDSGVTI